MLSQLTRSAKAVGIDTRALYQKISAASLRAALNEQDLMALCDDLRQILPNVSDQYTDGFREDEFQRYWELKLRGLHAFQMQCILEALDVVGGNGLTLADIGDSSGNHAAYIQALAKPGQVNRVISVNLDPVAVDKIRTKGGDAILCRAEEMDIEKIHPDLFLSFEMVEHLTDPARFFYGLAKKGSAEYMLITVPYRARSRFGGHHLRLPKSALTKMTPEEVHIYEFSMNDWILLARFAGWQTLSTRTYWQYPRIHPLRITQPLWQRLDFEGFIGMLMKRDLTVAEHYTGW